LSCRSGLSKSANVYRLSTERKARSAPSSAAGRQVPSNSPFAGSIRRVPSHPRAHPCLCCPLVIACKSNACFWEAVMIGGLDRLDGGLLPGYSPGWRQEPTSRLPTTARSLVRPTARATDCSRLPLLSLLGSVIKPSALLAGIGLLLALVLRPRGPCWLVEADWVGIPGLVRCVVLYAASHARRRPGESAHSSYGSPLGRVGSGRWGMVSPTHDSWGRRTVGPRPSASVASTIAITRKMSVPGQASNGRGGSTSGRSRAGRGSRRPRSIQTRGCYHVRR
jgi:hypothetical protein